MREIPAFFSGAMTTAVLAVLAPIAMALIMAGPAHSAGAERPVVVYTAQTATTAQLPLMAAIKAGWPGKGREVEINYWKNLDDLRALVLAGKGDIWIGHVEALARAASRGAPVALAEITAWRKFYLISVRLPLDEGAEPRHPASVAELLDFAASHGLRLGSSPPNSPMTDLLSRLGDGKLIIDSMAPQQLILEMSTGKRLAGMLPEPQASAAEAKSDQIQVVGSLEAERSRRFGGHDWQPQAAIAVNLAFLKESPELVASLIEMAGPLTQKLAAGPPEDAAATLPEETAGALGLGVLIKSLGRELIMAKPASEVKAEIESFIKEAAPELYQPGGSPPPETFFLPAKTN